MELGLTKAVSIVSCDRFEEKFRYDDKGLPKVWKPEDDIDSYFKKARDEVSSACLLTSSSN